MLDSHATDNLPRGTICIEDIEIGMTRHLRKQITDRDIALFAEVSTDHNPVHLDDEYARDTIFGGRIAHGMLTAGLISAVIGEQLPGHGSVYLGQSLKFLAPVRPGDQVEARVAQTLQSRGGFREEFNLFGAVQVVLFVDERSVAIEKNSGFPGVSRHR